jgi:hypothetical protein
LVKTYKNYFQGPLLKKKKKKKKKKKNLARQGKRERSNGQTTPLRKKRIQRRVP